jgi:ribonuclease-3
MKKKLANLEKKLGYNFSDHKLLELALRHRSVGALSNERLEFLGDAILNFVIAELLYTKYPDVNEGKLSRLRANLVKEGVLAELAKGFSLSEFIILGVGERKSGGTERSSILADSLEAVIGAIYLDGGDDVCKKIIANWFSVKLDDLSSLNYKDAKSQLQEYLQAHKLALPVYEIIDIAGVAHRQSFSIQCSVNGLKIITVGKGPNKRDAEMRAAEEFLKKLKNSD